MSGTHVRKLRDALHNIVIENSMGREFIPQNAFEKLMTREVVRSVFGDIVWSKGSSSYHPLDFQRWQVVFEEYRKVLAVLVFIGKEELIMSFLHRGRGDKNLPFFPEELRIINPILPNSHFPKKQYCFIAVEFKMGEEKHLHEDWILPFVKDTPIMKGEGAFGKIYEVEIHESYYDPNMWFFVGDEKRVFARKELMPDESNEIDFEMEKSALKILQAKCQHPNIVPLLACYKYGHQYSFIFPRADCDLDMYFRSDEYGPPKTVLETYQLFERISKLASALHEIHNCDITFDAGGQKVDFSQIGYHRDLKPKNILKLGNVFMISDFGLARFKENLSVSKTKWALGISTYMAPECKPKAEVGRLADIWSLGCIFSEVVTFALLGKEGIEQYSRRRKRQYGGDGCDMWLDFFYEKDKVMEEVLEWFEHLRIKSDRNPFIVEILQLVEEMLTPVSVRPRAIKVMQRFSEILERERNRNSFPKTTPPLTDAARPLYASPEPIWSPPIASPTLPILSPSHEVVLSPFQEVLNPYHQNRIQPIINHFEGTMDPPQELHYHQNRIQPIRTQEGFTHSTDRRYTLVNEKASKMDRSNSEKRPWTSQGLSIDMERHMSNDSNPKVTSPGPPPLLYKVPGFLAKSQKGKSPFGYLKEFDTVFLIDDSESMSNQWDNVALALCRFLDLATLYDGDGVDLHFMRSPERVNNARTVKEVFSTLRRIQPSGSTSITLSLDNILMDYVSRFTANRRLKRLNLIVITDGDITSLEDPADPIIGCAKSLDSIMAPACQVGVQFVLIGSDEKARQIFGDIDDDVWRRHNVRDIADTTPYDPEMDGRDDETLLKIMCGAVNRLLDNRSS